MSVNHASRVVFRIRPYPKPCAAILGVHIMPKSIVIEPEKSLPAKPSASPIFRRTLTTGHRAELHLFSEDLLNIWRDMCAIREFETILNEIKTKGAYKGVAYNHAGPAHLSMGRKPPPSAWPSPGPEDHIFARTAATARSPKGSPPSAS